MKGLLKEKLYLLSKYLAVNNNAVVVAEKSSPVRWAFFVATSLYQLSCFLARRATPIMTPMTMTPRTSRIKS